MCLHTSPVGKMQIAGKGIHGDRVVEMRALVTSSAAKCNRRRCGASRALAQMFILLIDTAQQTAFKLAAERAAAIQGPFPTARICATVKGVRTTSPGARTQRSGLPYCIELATSRSNDTR
jgi:hypothetical protein